MATTSKYTTKTSETGALERALVVLVFIQSLSPPFSAQVPAMLRMSPFPLAAAVCGLVAVRPAPTLALLRVAWPIAPLVLLAFFSSAWSDDSVETLNQAFLFLSSFLFSLYVTSRFSLLQILRHLLLALCCIHVLCAFALFTGQPTAFSLAGEWKGIFPHKNILGQASLMGCLVTATLALADPSRLGRRAGAALYPLFLVSVLGSESVTAAISLSLALAVTAVHLICLDHFGRRALRWGYGMAAAAGGGLLLVGVSENYVQKFFELFGRTPSLTGRLPLWEKLVPYLLERPYLGFGYESFWVLGSDRIAAFYQVVRWRPPHAHNGYLDVLLTLGPIGLAMVLTMILQFGARLVAPMRNRGEQLFCLLMWSCTVALNLSEVTLIKPFNCWWIVFTIAFIVASRNASRDAFDEPALVSAVSEPLMPEAPITGRHPAALGQVLE